MLSHTGSCRRSAHRLLAMCFSSAPLNRASSAGFPISSSLSPGAVSSPGCFREERLSLRLSCHQFCSTSSLQQGAEDEAQATSPGPSNARVKEDEGGVIIKVGTTSQSAVKKDACGEVEEAEDEMEEMFVMGPSGRVEWGGPTRGGRHKEPTRFGDWERKGRCTDFS